MPQKAGIVSFLINVWITSVGYIDIVYTITIIDVTNISLNFTDLTLAIGQFQYITPTITHKDAQTTLTWTSSNASVATVNQNGKVIAKGAGTATITCMASNGVKAQCTVTVPPTTVESLTMSTATSSMNIGETQQLSVSVSPDDATDKSVTWSSTNDAVAIVNESGLVTAVSSGTCQIKATANDGSGKVASCVMTVHGNMLFCEDFSAAPGSIITLPIQLMNEDVIQGFEFKLVLNSDVRVIARDGQLTATLTDRATTQGLESRRLTVDTYHFVYTSATPIKGTDGVIVNLPIIVGSDIAVGKYDVVIKDVELVKYGTSSQIHQSDRTVTLTIKDFTMGDVNGDGRVSVADAISVLNYVLGRTPVSFITAVADVNNDGGISLADVVAIVDVILKRNNSNSVNEGVISDLPGLD